MKEEKEYREWIENMWEKYHLKLRISTKEEGYLLASKFNYPYLDATIIYSEESIKDWKLDRKEAERRIVHEFCHIITDQFYSVVINWPTKNAIEEARERLNDHIAQIVNKHFNLIQANK